MRGYHPPSEGGQGTRAPPEKKEAKVDTGGGFVGGVPDSGFAGGFYREEFGDAWAWDTWEAEGHEDVEALAGIVEVAATCFVGLDRLVGTVAFAKFTYSTILVYGLGNGVRGKSSRTGTFTYCPQVSTNERISTVLFGAQILVPQLTASKDSQRRLHENQASQTFRRGITEALLHLASQRYIFGAFQNEKRCPPPSEQLCRFLRDAWGNLPFSRLEEAWRAWKLAAELSQGKRDACDVLYDSSGATSFDV